MRRKANFAEGTVRNGSAALTQRPGDTAKKRLAAANAAARIAVPVSNGSALDDHQLAKLIDGLARRIGVRAPIVDGHVDPVLLDRLLNTAARQLGLPPHDGRPLGRRAGGKDRLHPRWRHVEDEDPVLYDKRTNRATPFRLSQRGEAEAWVDAEDELDRMKTMGKILPTQFPLSKVLDQMVADAKPVSPTERETLNFSTYARRVEALRRFYAGKRLIDVPGSEAAYFEQRSAMPGRKKMADGSFEGVSRETIRGELEIFQTGLNRLTRFGCTWIPKLEIPEKKKPRATFLYGREVTMLMMACHGWTWDYEKDDWRWREVEGKRGLEWDRGSGVLRIVEAGGARGAVKRPLIDFAYRRNAFKLRRMVVIGTFSGTRHLAALRLRWTRNGEDGWVDFAKNVLHRADLRHGQGPKRQGDLDMPAILVRYLAPWAKLDGFAGPVVRKRNGGRYETYLNQQFKDLVERAGLRDMPVSEDDRRFVDSEGEPIDIVFHILRHTCATWMRERGVPLHLAADFLGMSPATLERVYGKWTLGGLGHATQALDAIGWSPFRGPNLPRAIPPVAILPPILRQFPPESST